MNRREYLVSSASVLMVAASGAKVALAASASSRADLANMSVQEIIAGYRNRSLSPVTYMEHVLKRIETLDPRVNAFYYTDANGARAAAAEAERRWAAGRPIGPLDGLPFATKDQVFAKDMPSPMGLKVNRDIHPELKDAPATARLREAGAISVGKNTQPELASLATTISGLYGIGHNPWNLTKSPGGSSGGSAAAVAADMVPLSIGGDAGGSLRLPASYCGVIGVKASGGRIPRFPTGKPYGVHGPIVRHASDLPIVMNVLTKPDASDTTALPYDGVDYTKARPDILKGKRIAFTDWFGFGLPTSPGVAAAFHQAIEHARSLGATLVRIDPPFTYDPFDKMAPMFAAAARNNALKMTGGRLDTLLPVLQAWFAEGEYVTPAEMQIGMTEQNAVVERMSRLMDQFDFLLTPTSPITPDDADMAFPRDVVLRPVNPMGPVCGHAAGPKGVDGTCKYGEQHTGRFGMVPFTFPFNYSFHPAISIPCGLSGSMPVGLQVVGRTHDDYGCLQAAIALEGAIATTFVAPLVA